MNPKSIVGLRKVSVETVIEKDGTVTSWVPEIPGCRVHAKDRDAALMALRAKARELIQSDTLPAGLR